MNSKDYERHLLAKEAERERELLHQQEVEKRMRDGQLVLIDHFVSGDFDLEGIDLAERL